MARSGKKYQQNFIISRLVLMIALFITIFPIYWMVITSFKQQAEIYRSNPSLFPIQFTASGYIDLITKTKYLNGLKNSFIVAFTVALGTILLGFPCSYSIAKLNFCGRHFLSRAILFTYLIPASVLYIPMYRMLAGLNLTNNLFGLMLIYPTSTIPYAVWILTPYIKTIPTELEEAAYVDGCSKLVSMIRIVFPLSLPGIITTFVFSFTICWGEYLYALVSMIQENSKTMPLIISGLIWGDMYPWQQIMAGGIIACGPIILIYMFASKYLISGLTAGGIKM